MKKNGSKVQNLFPWIQVLNIDLFLNGFKGKTKTTD